MYLSAKRRDYSRVFRTMFTLMGFGKAPVQYRRAGEIGAKSRLGARAILRVRFTGR